MSELKPEISKKNEYWISRHRFYELKHYCLQYSEWKYELANMTYLQSHSVITPSTNESFFTDSTCDSVERITILKSKISRVEKTIKTFGEDLWEYLFIGITKGYRYDVLKARLDIPCSKEKYYKLYRKIFYMLSISQDSQFL